VVSDSFGVFYILFGYDDLDMKSSKCVNVYIEWVSKLLICRAL
jgi:hypothetical protein